jgi:hypothetical protein
MAAGSITSVEQLPLTTIAVIRQLVSDSMLNADHKPLVALVAAASANAMSLLTS